MITYRDSFDDLRYPNRKSKHSIGKKGFINSRKINDRLPKIT